MRVDYLKATLLTIAIVFTYNVQANMMDTSNNSFIDQNTGLEWIDFGVNNGKSYNYVVSQLTVGGEYEGWSLPTEDQVYKMWADAFLGLGATSETDNYYDSGELIVKDGESVKGSVISDRMQIMGGWNLLLGMRMDEEALSYGMFMDQYGLRYVEVIYYTDFFSGHYSRYEKIVDQADIASLGYNYFSDNSYGSARDQSGKYSSTLLVKNAMNVPAPSSFVILILGLLGIILSRKITSK